MLRNLQRSSNHEPNPNIGVQLINIGVDTSFVTFAFHKRFNKTSLNNVPNAFNLFRPNPFFKNDPFLPK